MSALTEALNRIMSWLERCQPDYAQPFLPGLSRAEIDDALHEFEIVVSEEFYELYQWRNGRMVEPFINTYAYPSIYEFLPLYEVIEGTRGINFLPNRYSNNFLLPFIGHTDPELCVLELNDHSDKSEKKNPILIIFEGTEAQFFAPSITALFSFFAEAYEEGAYYLGIEEDIDGFVCEDEEKVRETMEKHGLSVSALTA